MKIWKPICWHESFIVALWTYWHSHSCYIRVKVLCILLFYKFLAYFISVYFLCISGKLLIVFILQFESELIARYKKFCKWPQRQNKHCSSASQSKPVMSHVYLYTIHLHKCRFWANMVSICEYKTSRDFATDDPIFANLVSLDECDLIRENSWKGVSRSAAIARQSRISYRGSTWPPPPS